MRLLLLIICLSCVRATGFAQDADELKVAERLAGRVRETLDSMLGPGRAQVLVEVRGVRLVVQTELEIVAPLDKEGRAAATLLELPGYTKTEVALGGEKAPEKKAELKAGFFQKEHEHSRRDAGFEIKSIAATVVFDAALSSEAVREASQLLPQLLRIDDSRGDTLTILRASQLSAWKAAFATPKDWRSAAYAAVAALVALLVTLIGAASFIRAARVFASELSARRRTAAPVEDLRAPMLPELSGGLSPGLMDADFSSGGAAAPLALGQRFDFLSGSDAATTARVLAAVEAPELALLFGYLAESMPETASRLFSSLPAEVQAETSRCLLKLSVAEPERLSALEDRIKVAVANRIEGPELLAKILSRVPGDTRADMLDRLALEDAGAVEDVQSLLFSFEDIVRLSPAELRRLLGAVPYEVWGVALRGAPTALLDRVLSDLPDGPRQFVRDAAQAPQPRDKIVAARSTVLDVLSGLAAKGQVSAGGTSPEGGLV